MLQALISLIGSMKKPKNPEPMWLQREIYNTFVQMGLISISISPKTWQRFLGGETKIIWLAN